MAAAATVVVLGLSSTSVSVASTAVLRSANPGANSPFAIRGVIEGFYGTPWTASEAEGMLTWMGKHGMNTFIYAPKDDPYARTEWRDSYPAEDLTDYKNEVATAEMAGITFTPEISPGYPLIPDASNPEAPGQDICFSCTSDQQLLISKLQSLWRIGVRAFAVDFDDSYEQLTHPQDIAAYGTGTAAYGAANVALLNLVYKHFAALDPAFKLFTVLAEYSGTTSSPYLATVKADLNPHVIVMWTGNSIISPTVTCADVAGYARAIGREPLLWDNFPVNDIFSSKPVVGPYEGRTSNLGSCMRGVVANPALQVEADRIPLATVADYLNDPYHYNAEASWDESIRAFGGSQTPELHYLVDNTRSTPLDPTESVQFTALRNAFTSTLTHPSWQPAYSALSSYLHHAEAASAELNTRFPDREFIYEMNNLIDSNGGQSFPGTYSALTRLAVESGYGIDAARAMAGTRPRVTAALERGRLIGTATEPMTAAQTANAEATIEGNISSERGYPDVVYGDRASADCWIAELEEGFPCGNNQMDPLLSDAVSRLSTYEDEATSASASLTVSVDGKPVPLETGDGFDIPFKGEYADVTVEDGAGQTTSELLRSPPSIRPGTLVVAGPAIAVGTQLAPSVSVTSSDNGRLSIADYGRVFTVPDRAQFTVQVNGSIAITTVRGQWVTTTVDLRGPRARRLALKTNTTGVTFRKSLTNKVSHNLQLTSTGGSLIKRVTVTGKSRSDMTIAIARPSEGFVMRYRAAMFVLGNGTSRRVRAQHHLTDLLKVIVGKRAAFMFRMVVPA